MKLIITIDIPNLNVLEGATQSQINTIIAEGFEQYSEFSAEYKNIAKFLFISTPNTMIDLSLPDILLLGFIRQRLINQEGRTNTEITLKALMQDYNAVKQRKNIFELGNSINYHGKILEESILKLQDENFVTIAKVENV
jgi:DNA-binding ferritin-like protein (Dps family)